MSPSVPLCLFVLSANDVGLDVLSRLVTPMGSLTAFLVLSHASPRPQARRVKSKFVALRSFQFMAGNKVKGISLSCGLV